MNKAVKLLATAGLISTLGISTLTAQKTMNEDFRKPLSSVYCSSLSGCNLKFVDIFVSFLVVVVWATAPVTIETATRPLAAMDIILFFISSSLISVSKHEDPDPFNFGFRYGEVIELTAPGVNVRTAWLNNSYKNLTGNSFACPHIVGIIALLLEKYPELTPFQVKSALYAIAQENQEREKLKQVEREENSSI